MRRKSSVGSVPIDIVQITLSHSALLRHGRLTGSPACANVTPGNPLLFLCSGSSRRVAQLSTQHFSMWSIALNAALGSLVVTVGFWLVGGTGSAPLTGAVAVGLAGFLFWRGSSIWMVWAWTTALLGLESLAWPLVTMIQIRQTSAQPTDEQMGYMLVAALFGLFSAVFWLSFSYGLFKRVNRTAESHTA